MCYQKSLLYGLLALVLANAPAYADNPNKYAARRGCQFEKTGPSPGRNFRTFLLRPNLNNNGSRVQILVDEAGTPRIRAINTDRSGVPNSLFNVSSAKIEQYWGGGKSRKEIKDGIRTLDFSNMNQNFRIDFFFKKGQLKQFRVKSAVCDQRKFNLGNLPKPGVVSLGIKNSWCPAK